ncbi:hypothetical protein Tco_1434817 [Tanacetum coccineum]
MCCDDAYRSRLVIPPWQGVTVDVSKVISMMESMSLEFDKVRKEKTSTCSFLGPFPDEPYVQTRNAAMADDDIEDDDVEDDDDMDDDDAANPSDP